MKRLITLLGSCLFVISITAQTGNIGIATTTPGGKLQINHKNTGSSPSLILFDSVAGTGSRLQFKKEGQSNNFSLLSTIDLFAANSSLDLRTTFNSGIFLRGDGRVGINNITNPAATLHVGGGVRVQDSLHVGGDMNIEGKLKINGNTGTANQVLISNGTGASQTWENISSVVNGSGGVGFGTWGDCSMNNISEYNPVTDTSGAMNDNFGTSASISGNYAIVGANHDDGIAGADQGSVSIYQYNGINWVTMQKITDATGAGFDDFGVSVSISGNYAIVGARFDDGPGGSSQGSASIYQLSGSTWVLMQKIVDATGAAQDNFGFDVSISGNYAIVSAPFDDGPAGLNQGSASIYQLISGTWILMQKIVDATGAAEDNFGKGVSISGSYAIIGAPNDDNGSNVNEGSASIYQLSGGAWVLMNTITALGGSANDNFGNCVSLSGNSVIVGAPNDDDIEGTDLGAVHFYQFNGSTWAFMGKFSDVTPTANEHFGASVSISGIYAISGTLNNANIFMRVGLGWRRLQVVTDPLRGSNETFGSSSAIDGVTKRFLVGVPNYASGSGKCVFGKIN